MKRLETKIIPSIFFIIGFFILGNLASAQEFSSSSFKIQNPVIDEGSSSTSSASFGLGQSIGQTAIGKSTSASFQLWSGFQYFFKVNANVLTATADVAEVDLSWTVPQTFLGATIAGYEVGTGTISGSYVFQNVGNVTNFTKTGLTNGTPYFFIVKTYAPGGTFLVYSNEATATPNGVTPPPPPPPSGGGGGSGSYVNIEISGKAYPNAAVTLLRDSIVVANSNADSAGNFNFNQSGLSAGTYTFTLYATDLNNVKSASLSFERTIANAITTTVNNLIIAPTLQSNFSSVKQGEPINLTGYTAPNSQVTISLSGPQSAAYTVISNAQGSYSVFINSATLIKGEYNGTAASLVSNNPSPPSLSIKFIVGDATIVPPPPGQCGRSDLNCDGRVDLVDFSILLYYWESSDLSRNPRVDIDKSGEVGLRDLSIMLYDWTG
jgi:hypothetical protein